jgi:hypothetical protein
VNYVTDRSRYSTILTAACYANGLSVATSYYEGYGEVLVSSNFVDWTAYYPYPQLALALYAVVYGNKCWVAVGGWGTIWTSPNAKDWQIINPIVPGDLTGVSYAQDKFVAVGDGGVAMSSTNGIAWTTNNSTTTNHLNDVIYGQGYFLAVGVNGTLIRSIDGIHWKSGNINTTETLTSIAYGDGYWVAVGLDGDIFTSSDSFSWTVQSSPSSWQLSHIAFGNHEFLAVGLAGMIVQSDPFIHLSLARTNVPILNITGPTNRIVVVQTTTNLNATQQWTEIGTVSLTNQPTVWRDTQAGVGSSRFYRVMLPQ